MTKHSQAATQTDPNRNIPKSGRSFGLMIAAVLVAIAAYRWIHGASLVAVLAIMGAGVSLGTIALIHASLLDPVARAWLQLGKILGMIVSPVVLAVIFFLLVTPLAVVARLFGRDELRLKKPAGASYWVERKPTQPRDKSFEHPF